MNYLVTKNPKSLGIAILLVALFGPLGLFYASVLGGITMCILAPIVAAVGFFIIAVQYPAFLFFFIILSVFLIGYIIPFIWCITAINSYNRELERNAINLSSINIPQTYTTQQKEEKSNIGPYLLVLIIFCVIMILAASKLNTAIKNLQTKKDTPSIVH